MTEFSRQYRIAVLFCGSWLACDAGTLVYQAQPVDAIAGKPAPTFDRVQTTPIYLIHRNPNVGAGLPAKAVGQSAHVSLADRLREQARSHNLTEFSRQHCTALLLLFCGSWLACDAGSSVYQAQPVDAIAGKPAPTFDRVQTTAIYLIHRNPNVGAGLLANAVGQSAHVSLVGRLREQARSHKLTEFSCQHRTTWLFCGSWLACDAGTLVYQRHTGDAIAGKPAPTFD
ncbi:hypothetical protein HKK58_01285 [Pseudomonas sp. ADAK22]|uniref:hypothetical protein n=1 Tax=Pseudomonas sp. ADAK22 TaxID=2730851 RepID=UPI001462F594|nr:hypothetical protein [Pseudomonas sp. ADAK22]QJI10973.1 hypothetical protein HKK58_01285 [Pseudomonas sp. ADAK22]